MQGKYKIELDIFSGQPNPSFEITKEDFVTFLDEINKLEEADSSSFYDGLGFRGIIVLEVNSIFIFIQNKVIRLETFNSVKYFESNPDIVLRAINLFKYYDKEDKYKTLIEEAIKEYL